MAKKVVVISARMRAGIGFGKPTDALARDADGSRYPARAPGVGV